MSGSTTPNRFILISYIPISAYEGTEQSVSSCRLAYGMNDEHGSLSKVLEADVKYFRNQVSDMLSVMNFHSINLSV